MSQKNAKYSSVIIPVVVAVVVIIAFAVSGHITKKADEKNPTARPTVSIANSDDATTQKSVSKNINSKVTITAVGDNLIHNTIIASGEQEDGKLDYTALYKNIKPDIEAADIAVINQETVLGGESFDYTGYPLFNSPWEIGDAAIDAGFDVFTCATNHSLDMGWAGIEKETEYFSSKKGVVQLGVNASAERNIVYYEKNDITFALLNYTFGTNNIALPSDKPWCVNLLDKDKVKSDVTEARGNADVVIVFPHWGNENSHKISDYQKEYTKLFSDLGVDIVIGTHTHTLQPVEWVTNEKTKKRMLVYYSLGNFISHQIQLYQLLGGMARITVEKNGDEIEISSAKLVPLVCLYKRNDRGFEFDVYKLGDYTDDIAQTHAQNGATNEYFTNLVKENMDDEFIDMK